MENAQKYAYADAEMVQSIHMSIQLDGEGYLIIRKEIQLTMDQTRELCFQSGSLQTNVH